MIIHLKFSSQIGKLKEKLLTLIQSAFSLGPLQFNRRLIKDRHFGSNPNKLFSDCPPSVILQSIFALQHRSISETKFINTKLSDLGKTYKSSILEQQKVLLGSTFPSGIAWNYLGISNRNIGPVYQSIVTFTNGGVPFGDPGGIRTRDLRDENPIS